MNNNQFNKSMQTIKNYVDENIPTKTSQLTNDSDFATNTNVNNIIQDYTGGKKFSSPMTKAEYDAIADKDPNTVYLIEDEEESVIVELPNYSTNDANKILAVNAQGTALAWIDKPTGSLQEIDLTAYAKKTDLPTKTSQLTNDSNFADKSYVVAEISKVSVGGGAVFREPTLREVFTCTVPNNFSDASAISIDSGNTTTGANIKLCTRVNKCPNTPEVITITTSSNMRSNKSELTFTRTNYYEMQYFTVTPLSAGEGTVTITAPNGYTNTARFTITGEDVSDAPTLSSISATYTQGSTVVYPDTSLDTLKSNLVVKANYSDGSQETVTSYSLSGTLNVGTSAITVTYGSKTTTFNVVVVAKEEQPVQPTLSSISAVYTQGGTTVYPDTSLDTLKTSLVVTAHYSDNTQQTVTNYTLSGNLTVGTSTITVSYENKTTTFNVTVTAKEQQPETPTPSGDYVTDGLTHMVDFTQYPIGYTGEILDAITNQALVASNLDSYTKGRAGFVEEGMFSAGGSAHNVDVSAYISESSIGQLTYPITIEGYVRLRNRYNVYGADGVRELDTERRDVNIFSTRDTSDTEGAVDGIWVKYIQSINTFSVIETLNNTNISAPEGTATPLFAYNIEDLVWTHILIVFGANDKRLYINGELVVSGSGGTGTPSKACCIKFSQFDWKVFRMYNKALTAEEVQNNYNVTISTMGGNQ